MLIKRNSPISSYWFLLGGLLAYFGGIPLLSGRASSTQDRFAAIAKLLVGAAVFAFAFWVRRRERNAIARGTMPPNE